MANAIEWFYYNNNNSVLDPLPYSGGGGLYNEDENESDITRSTTLAFVNFDGDKEL